MKKKVAPFIASLLVLSISGCALIPDRPPEPTSTPPLPVSGYEPQPGDDKLERGQVYLETDNSAVIVEGEPPVTVKVLLTGNLPDPCHQLRVVVSPPNDQKEIRLDVYSVFDRSVMCIMVLTPFSVSIPLGKLYAGHYTVFVNGQLIGAVDG